MRAALRKVISLDFGAARDPSEVSGQVRRLPDDVAERKVIFATNDRSALHHGPRWLEQAGFNILTATSPTAALELATFERPDLYVVDATLQDRTSCLLIDALRQITSEDAPLFALCPATSDIELALAAGASDVVRRPFNWEVVTHRLVSLMQTRHQSRELETALAELDEARSRNTEAEREKARREDIDGLTGLPTRERFRRLSLSAVSAQGNRDKETAMLVVRVDRYRMVNEAIGHASGNRLLGMFADRLRACLSEQNVIGCSDGGTVTAILGRLNGARFAVQVSNGDGDQVARFHKALTAALERPFLVNGQSVYLSASIGAARYPQHCDSADELLVFAESALLEAKRLGSGLHIFEPQNRVSGVQVLKLDCMLRHALKHDELDVHFQPITATESGDVVAAEALLRWNHPVEGPISPGQFVPVAEKTGLMRDIGDFVIERSCAQLRNWIDQGMQPIRIAVNVSLCQLLRGDIVDKIEAALTRFELDPKLLELELSERGVLNQHPEVIAEVRRLKATGVRISIDDFGTGQAAISYLKSLPIDVIKIDRSYVSGPERTSRDTAIASGIVAMADRLDATVIAEGVETPDQLDMLKGWGSQECQGFLFSEALSGDEFFARYATA